MTHKGMHSKERPYACVDCDKCISVQQKSGDTKRIQPWKVVISNVICKIIVNLVL